MSIKIFGVVMGKKPYHLHWPQSHQGTIKGYYWNSISSTGPGKAYTLLSSGTQRFCVYFRGMNEVSYFDDSGWID